MKGYRSLAPCLFAVAVLVGCASTKTTGGHAYHGERLARPDRIIVHPFAATPADIPSWSDAARRHTASSTTQSAEEIATGRKLGALVAQELVTEIQGMGLPAVVAAGQPEPRDGDVVVIGYFASVEEGSAAKRVVVGFGTGGAHLQTHIEGYVMTDRGLRELGYRDVEAGAGKMPGVALPLAVAIATANPIGLVVGGAMKVGGEVSGKSTIEGAAKRTAKQLGKEARFAFQQQGWI